MEEGGRIGRERIQGERIRGREGIGMGIIKEE